jgi:hypothetical protein
MAFPGLSADFNEPQSNDPTSAPEMPDQQPSDQPIEPQQGRMQGFAAALARRKKKKGTVGPTVRQPSALAAAIARAKRARPSTYKNG